MTEEHDKLKEYIDRCMRSVQDSTELDSTDKAIFMGRFYTIGRMYGVTAIPVVGLSTPVFYYGGELTVTDIHHLCIVYHNNCTPTRLVAESIRKGMYNHFPNNTRYTEVRKYIRGLKKLLYNPHTVCIQLVFLQRFLDRVIRTQRVEGVTPYRHKAKSLGGVTADNNISDLVKYLRDVDYPSRCTLVVKQH